jgi:hypothetical protein
MIRNKDLPLIVIVITLSVLPFIIFIAVHHDTRCDTEITMKNGISYRVMRKSHTSEGMTWVRFCDGSELIFPTADIQTIKSIK